MMDPYSIWSHRNASEKEAHAEIENSSDRAAAVLGAAFIDDRLTEAIKARFHQDKKVLERLFGHAGALSTFSAKIDVAFSIGMLSKEAIEDLHVIRKVRNEFAHNLRMKSFAAAPVRDLIKNIHMSSKTLIKLPGGKNTLTLTFPPPASKIAKPPPRYAFISCCQCFILILDHLRNVHPEPPKPNV
jgi:hypothetical protein